MDNLDSNDDGEIEDHFDPSDIEVIDIDELEDEHSEELDDVPISDEEVEDVPDMSFSSFGLHNGSIFCCDISPSMELAATGGEDDTAYIWNYGTGTLVHKCLNHKDSVTHVAFSSDGALLATADMGGFIQVWKLAPCEKVWDFEVGDITWLKWHCGAHVLLVSTVLGELWMWLIPNGNTRTFPSYGIAAECGSFTKDGRRALVGYRDGSVRLFDLKSGSVLCQWEKDFIHSLSVISLDCHNDNTLAITGSVDGSVKLLNTFNGKIVGSLNYKLPAEYCGEIPPEEVDHTVEVVSFCPFVHDLAITISLSGLVVLWDTSTQTPRHTIYQGIGSSKLVWTRPEDDGFFTAGLDGILRLYGAHSGSLITQFTGHTQSIMDMALSNDGHHILSVGDDKIARVFKYNK